MPGQVAIRSIAPSNHSKQRALKGHKKVTTGSPAPRGPSGLALPEGTIAEPQRVIYTYPTPAVTRVSSGGGATVRSAKLEVLFWGNGWKEAATTPSMNEVASAVEAIVASPYLSELDQYGFQQLESTGFHLVTSDPPAGSYTSSDVKTMVWGLIDDDQFPEPDDPGGRIIYMVIPHPGTSYTGGDIEASGAHTAGADYDFPADVDWAWISWVNFGSLDSITATFTHELVETITDPEPNSGWTTDKPEPLNEICDLCVNQNGPVGDFAAAAYYSKRLGKCVVPSKPVLRNFQLAQRDQALGKATVSAGLTTAKSGRTCFSGVYHWRLFSQGHEVVLTAELSSYIQPNITWKINGQQVYGATTLTFPVDDSYDPLVEIAPEDLPAEMITVSTAINSDQTALTLTCPGDAGAVLIQVDCSVEEGAFPPGYISQRTVTIPVFLSGRTRVMDSRFMNDRLQCTLSHLGRLGRAVQGLGPLIDKGDPAPPWVDSRMQKLLVEISERLERGISELEHLAEALKAGAAA